MSRIPPLLVVSTFVAACGGQQVPSRSPDEFCEAIVAGDLVAAGESAHAALVAAGAEESEDASEPLAAWLRSQPCVAAVEVPSEVIETDPGIREITIVLAPDRDGAVRQCVADLRLVAGARVGIHPATWVSTNPDTHCTVVP